MRYHWQRLRKLSRRVRCSPLGSRKQGMRDLATLFRNSACPCGAALPRPAIASLNRWCSMSHMLLPAIRQPSDWMAVLCGQIWRPPTSATYSRHLSAGARIRSGSVPNICLSSSGRSAVGASDSGAPLSETWSSSCSSAPLPDWSLPLLKEHKNESRLIKH